MANQRSQFAKGNLIINNNYNDLYVFYVGIYNMEVMPAIGFQMLPFVFPDFSFLFVNVKARINAISLQKGHFLELQFYVIIYIFHFSLIIIICQFQEVPIAYKLSLVDSKGRPDFSFPSTDFIAYQFISSCFFLEDIFISFLY